MKKNQVEILINDRQTPDNNDIANTFDTFFVDIDPNLASKIILGTKNHLINTSQKEY